MRYVALPCLDIVWVLQVLEKKKKMNLGSILDHYSNIVDTGATMLYIVSHFEMI